MLDPRAIDGIQNDTVRLGRDGLADPRSEHRRIELSVEEGHFPSNGLAGLFGSIRGDRGALADLSGRDDPYLLALLRLGRRSGGGAASSLVSEIHLMLRVGEKLGVGGDANARRSGLCCGRPHGIGDLAPGAAPVTGPEHRQGDHEHRTHRGVPVRPQVFLVRSAIAAHGLAPVTFCVDPMICAAQKNT